MVQVNPFIIQGYLSPEYFCDRVEETALLTRHLTNRCNVALIAPRRLGKSGLIYNCFQQENIREQYHCIYLDIYDTKNLKEFVYALGKGILTALKPKGRKVWEFFLNTLLSLKTTISFDINGNPEWSVGIGDIQTPEITLDEIFAYLEQADKPCLIAIDEFQQIGYYPEKNMEAVLRTYIQRCSNANFIFSGSERHLITEMFSEKARPFYNSADIMNLDVIPIDKYTEFAIGLFHHFDKDIQAEAIALAYHTFGGNTYYIQKVMHEAFNQTDPKGVADSEMIDAIIRSLILDNDRKFSEILSRLTLPQKELLYAIAKAGMAKQITSAAFVKKYNLRSASSVQSAIKKLLEYHLVSTSQATYYIDDQLMGLWLKM